MTQNKKFHLTVPGTIKQLRKIEALSNEVAQYCGLDEDTANGLAIAVTEVAGNAIVHGNQNNPEKSVDILFDVCSQTIRITIRDEGSGFDPDAIPDPLHPDNLLKESGRGIFILKEIMDGVRFDITKSGTTVHMTLNRKCN